MTVKEVIHLAAPEGHHDADRHTGAELEIRLTLFRALVMTAFWPAMLRDVLNWISLIAVLVRHGVEKPELMTNFFKSAGPGGYFCSLGIHPLGRNDLRPCSNVLKYG
jgi:hypothetical protein